VMHIMLNSFLYENQILLFLDTTQNYFILKIYIKLFYTQKYFI
jgi:hypothetical protein